MKEKRLFELIGLAADEFILEAEAEPMTAPEPRRKRSWHIWAAAAATIFLVAGAVGLTLGGLRMGSHKGAPADRAANGAGHEAGSSEFMSYAGPVLPLTVSDGAGIEARRRITYEFPIQAGEQMTVRDDYVLTNQTGEEIAVTGYYPYAGNFWELVQVRPTVTVDGQKQETMTRVGEKRPRAEISGVVVEEEEPEYDLSFWKELAGWKDYQALLEDGSYLKTALAEAAELSQPVTVYEFSDFTAPLEEYPAATQAVSFAADKEERQIFTYGFEGYGWEEETGLHTYSYFVPKAGRKEKKLLIVMGRDIGEYELTGYQDGGCEAGQELSGVSCTVTRRESTFGEVVSEVLPVFAFQDVGRALGEQAGEADAQKSWVSRLCLELVEKSLSAYGDFNGLHPEVYLLGRLEDLFSEPLSYKNVFYEEFSVTIPAGSSVTVQAVMPKWPSIDYYCGQSENADVRGYDMLTGAGSVLSIQEFTAAVEHGEHMEIIRQNFGFDLSNGVTEVVLNPAEQHYYMEVREKY